MLSCYALDRCMQGVCGTLQQKGLRAEAATGEVQ
jgi:hypothetical protein